MDQQSVVNGGETDYNRVAWRLQPCVWSSPTSQSTPTANLNLLQLPHQYYTTILGLVIMEQNPFITGLDISIMHDVNNSRKLFFLIFLVGFGQLQNQQFDKPYSFICLICTIDMLKTPWVAGTVLQTAWSLNNNHLFSLSLKLLDQIEQGRCNLDRL